MPDQADTRPRRARVLDELALPKSLPACAQDFLPLLGHGPDVLLLGLGPEPERLPELLGLPAGTAGRVRYIEAPDMAAQLGSEWRGRIPTFFEELPAGELLSAAAPGMASNGPASHGSAHGAASGSASNDPCVTWLGVTRLGPRLSQRRETGRRGVRGLIVPRLGQQLDFP